MAGISDKKVAYFEKLTGLLGEYNKILLVGADNVGSAHLQKIRTVLRGKGEILMGKNTMIRKCIRQNCPDYEILLPYLRGNVGFVFTKESLAEIKDLLENERVGAPAKAGVIAPNDVVVPAGPTGMEPTQTSFLQALNIASKINRGQVDIVSDVQLITKGEKVGSSEASLLQKLGIKPFTYGLTVTTVYDSGSVYDAEILSITDDAILAGFFSGVRQIAAFSLASGYPTVAAIPHSIANGFKNVVSIALGTEYSFPKAEEIKEMLENPGAFAVESTGGETKAAEPEPEPEPEEESDEDLGGGLFGDDDGW